MVNVQNLTKFFGDQLLFTEASFQINPGERIGVVGRNGSGKSTLFNLITGDEAPDEGEIQLPRHYSIGVLEQEINFSTPSVREEGCRGLPSGQEGEVWKAEKILSGLGFSEKDLDRAPGEFSGGYRLRICLAKVLVSQPQLLLLDEPTNFLDIVSIRWLGRFLKTWPGEIMLITHDRQFMDSLATHILSIHRQVIRKQSGSTSKMFEQIQLDEAVYEKTRVNEEKKRKQEELFISRFRAKARLAGMVQSRIKALEKKPKFEKLGRIQDLNFQFRSRPTDTKCLMRLAGVEFSYSKESPLLIKNLTMDITPEDRIAVAGRNGLGKSTLLKLLAEEVRPVRGEIRSHSSVKTGYFGESGIASLNPERTVEDEIQCAGTDLDRTQVGNICGLMMFSGETMKKKVSVLSGGEKSRVCLGKLLASPCNLLLLDEPTNHLDQESCETLIGAIAKFQGAVIAVSHNERFLSKISKRLVVFDGGEHRLYPGSYAQFVEEIGWSDEVDIRGGGSAKPDRGNRKDQKRKKAEIIQRKSKMLSGPGDKIKKLETSISEIEQEIHLKNEEMVAASQRNDGDSIRTISEDLKKFQKACDDLYWHLGQVTAKYEALEKGFEEELKGVEG